ncbi:MAG: VWA domain-containing protein [Pyrinomonadaceae bacterium]
MASALALFSASALAQVQPQPVPTSDDEVVKITSKLVQLDLLVIDRDGKQVRDLSAADFDILQDGKPQKITGFSYVNKANKPAPSSVVTKAAEKAHAIPPPVRITASNAGRIITFIIDDGNCSASMVGMTAAREGVQKFVREQMEPTDMVAIYQTRSGSSVFQQYTNDKERLLKAASKIKWTPQGGCSGDGTFYDAAKTNTFIKTGPNGTSTVTIETPEEKKIRESREDMTNNNAVVGALGVIRYVVRGLQKVPGRKIVFLMSDGMSVRSRSGDRLNAADVMRDLTDLSNRASVVFNTIDVRGLFDARMIEARDEVYADDTMLATTNIGDDRENQVRNSQVGLSFIARETGGRFYQGHNFLDVPIKKAMSYETGYYLLAYEPDEDTFRSKKFNKIEVKVKRDGLKVVSRTGFLGFVTEITMPKRRSENSELYEAIASPLPVPGLDVELTAYFGNSQEVGNFVRSFFHLDGSELTFVDDAGGAKKAVFDVVAVTMNEKNEVIDEFTRTHTLKLPAAAMPYISQNGLVYSADVPIKKPGTYNFRVAVRDGTSKIVGSAGQIVTIPDLKKTGLYVSGFTITEADNTGKFDLPAVPTASSAFVLPRTTAVPAIRKFRKGATLAYAYTIYNAKLDKSTGTPKITVQMNLYKDGKMVVEGTAQPTELRNQSDWSRINDFAYMRLRPDTEPGDYTIQIIIRDLSPDAKNASSQWVDFQILD